MSKKSKSTTVTTPTNPDWVTNNIQAASQKAASLASIDPSQYVAGPNALQTQAAQSASSLGSDDQWFSDLMNSSAPTVTASSLLDNLSSYQNPYTDQVVNSTLNDFDFNAAAQKAQQDLDLAGSNAFGGSGSALTKSMTLGQIARARAATDSGLRSDAFNTAASLSGQDADRRQQASAANAQAALQHQQFLANLGFGKAASDRANISSQLEAGGTLRDIASAQARAPLDLAQWNVTAQAGLPDQLFHGETTNSKTKTSDPIGAITSIASAASGLGAQPLAGWNPFGF